MESTRRRLFLRGTLELFSFEEWKNDYKCGAFATNRIHPNSSVVIFNNGFDDCQP
jgi:hypothetical protein